MEKVAFKNLSWPKGLNLSMLSDFLSEKDLIDLIVKNSSKSRTERRIILPSRKTILKVFCHFYGKLDAKGQMTWYEIMSDIRGDFETLKEIGIDRKRVKQLYRQRQKEIENGK